MSNKHHSHTHTHTHSFFYRRGLDHAHSTPASTSPTSQPLRAPASFTQVTIGVCAMSKKVDSKPMHEILNRLRATGFFEIVLFGDDCILNLPVNEWPTCEVLISFYSKGFPLQKAIEYAELRKPICVNDLKNQVGLLNRKFVYQTLKKNNIPIVQFGICERDANNELLQPFEEHEDCVIVDGVKIKKPFVEKPLSAEDHNVYIYYPSNVGGGSKRLFRKIGDRSSSFHPDISSVRTDGSYVYEEFVATEGHDVKVYTVGYGYAHAEARKSPSLDGKVERRADGKEQRYPVVLSAAEKKIASQIVRAFSQNVCGFDLLRTRTTSFVCDVNGWSFVKGSHKYYEDAGVVLTVLMLNSMQRVPRSLYLAAAQPESPAREAAEVSSGMELRCVIAVIRHGDRTPKQKIKFGSSHPKVLGFYHACGGTTQEIKLKSAKDLIAARTLVEELIIEFSQDESNSQEDQLDKLKQIKTALTLHGNFRGINRKIQIKPTVSAGAVVNVVMVVKWGGVLTALGVDQAVALGHSFRVAMYNRERGGLLRLHSTMRHDLKIYSSDEGRVQMTAAAFVKGFLDLEGELVPILVTMVLRNDLAMQMLDDSGKEGENLNAAKAKLRELLNKDTVLEQTHLSEACPTNAKSITDALHTIGNPREKLRELRDSVGEVCECLGASAKLDPDRKVHGSEDIRLLTSRWKKLLDSMYSAKTDQYDISKIPDIFDCATYDLLHNRSECEAQFQRVYDVVFALENFVVPQEYGLTGLEKYEIGRGISRDLWVKLMNDLQASKSDTEDMGETQLRLDESDARDVKSPSRRVRTRLYFTSESLLHSLVNVLTHSPCTFLNDSQSKISSVPGLGYVTQVVFKMYENTFVPPEHPKRFVVSVLFSDGIHGVPPTVPISDSDSDSDSNSNSNNNRNTASSTPTHSDAGTDSDQAASDTDTGAVATDTQPGPVDKRAARLQARLLSDATNPKPLKVLQTGVPLGTFFEFVELMKSEEDKA